MIQVLRKNNKAILAGVTIILMIAWVAAPSNKQGPGQGGVYTIGTALGEKITNVNTGNAAEELRFLSGPIYPGGPSYTAFTLAQILDPNPSPFDPSSHDQAMAYAQRIAAGIDAESFAIMLIEARQMGAAPGDELIQSHVGQIEKARGGAFKPEEREMWEIAVRDWQTVLSAFQRVSDAVKITPSEAEHALAVGAVPAQFAMGLEEKVALELIDFKAEQFAKDIPAPTADQLNAFFAKYHDEDPDKNEFSVGYRLPNRLRVEWIMVPYDQVLKGITGRQSYDYVKAHVATFDAATQPSTQPATAPATRPATERWALGNDVDRKARELLAEEFARGITEAIRNAYRKDYSDYHIVAKEARDPHPANAPETTLGAIKYYDAKYTEQLAIQISKRKEWNGVRPATVQDGELRSQKELAAMPPFTTIEHGDQLAAALFSTYEPFLSEAEKKQARDANRMLFDRYKATTEFALRDKDKNYYVFRIIEGSPAHPAPELKPIAEQVAKDYRNVEAYKNAKAAAEKFVAAAQKDGFAAAAKAEPDRLPVKTDLFSANLPLKFSQGKVPDPAIPALARGGFDLLQQRLATGKEHPVGVIELERSLSVAAAQLSDAKPATENSFMAQLVVMPRQQSEIVGALVVGWFNHDRVVQRTNFKPAETATKKPQKNDAPQEPAPLGT